MRYSDNYNLKLPQRGVDRANVDDLDDNFGIIDGALADDRQISLLMYDSTATYNTGAIRGYENPTTHRVRAYRCLEDNVTGPWDATKWAQTTLAAEIENGGGGGGSSTLAGLSDVDLDTPADGEVLTYDATEGKWVNAEGGSGGASELSDLDDVSLTTPTEGQILTYDGDEWVNADAPDVDVTKTASGNPIEISDGANAPLVKCVTEIQGSQNLHGYDKPWVGGAGKNKYSGDRNITLTSPGRIIPSDFPNVLFPGIYTFVFTIDGTRTNNAQANLRAFDENNALIVDETLILRDGDNYITFEVSTTIETLSCYTSNNATATFRNLMIISGAIPDYNYEPYSNICPITAYTEGEIEVSDGDGNTTTHTTTYPSAIYRGSEDVVNGEAVTEWGMIDSYAGETLPGEWISDRDEYAPGTTPTTGAQVAYELATPTTSPVTPTNLPIKSLNGYSHIESSTGDMEIEYIVGKYQPIVDLIQSSKHVYSTAEQVVGTWVDGKALYEKTLTYNQSYTYSNSGWGEIPFTGVPTDIETAISLDIIGGDDDGMQFHDGRVRYMVDLSGSTPKIMAYTTQAQQSVTWIIITMRYTKTASTRSLSKGTEKTSLEPISEPLETKTDNLSKDEKEPVEEDESKEIEELTEEPEEEPEVTEEEPAEEPVDPEPSKEEADER